MGLSKAFSLNAKCISLDPLDPKDHIFSKHFFIIDFVLKFQSTVQYTSNY